MVRSMSKSLVALTAIPAALALLAAQPAAGEERQLDEEQRAQIAQRIEEVRGRLNLSEDQKAAIEPLLTANLEERRTVMEKYGLDEDGAAGLSRRERSALAKELRALREKTNEQMAEILTEEQMREWTAIQEENRKRMRERMRKR